MGCLRPIPFAAIDSRSPDTMLVDHYRIIHLVNAHDILEDDRGEYTSDRVLLLGGISYDTPNRTPSKMRGKDFLPIPGTKMEVNMISSIVGKRATVLIGQGASEASFRKLAPGHRVLHLSTHGWATSDLMPLTDFGGLGLDIDSYFASLDPFLRAGVALAGANSFNEDATNDGILTAMEIAGLNLEGTELVVLAGCETVGSARAGESMLALVRSLREAGVHNVIVTLYFVLDETTPRFMASFYEDYITGIAPTEALRRAQIKAKNAKETTSMWAPFVVYATRPKQSP